MSRDDRLWPHPALGGRTEVLHSRRMGEARGGGEIGGLTLSTGRSARRG